MKKLYKFILLVFINQIIQAQIPTLNWAYSFGDSLLGNYGESIAHDDNGNIYSVGVFYGKVDFDPGADTFYLNSGNNWSIYYLKLDNSGNFMWAKNISSSWIKANDVYVDKNHNYMYVVGSFTGSADFDPGTSSNYLTSTGFYADVFIQKFDLNGNLQWVKALYSNSLDINATSISSDDQGNIFITGSFWGTVDFDPDSTVFELTSYPDSLSLGNNLDVFVLKLDSLGNFNWAKHMGGWGEDEGKAISVDGLGNVYTTGYYTQTADFETDTLISYNLTSTGGRQIFVQKIDNNGNLLWARSVGGIFNDEGFEITTDSLNDVYVTGYFTSNADFNPDSTNYFISSQGGIDAFVLKLYTNGDFAWAKGFGGNLISVSLYDQGNSISISQQGKVITVGSFYASGDFNPDGGGINTLSSNGSSDIFVHALDMNGNFIWAYNVGGLNNDYGVDATVDNNESIFVTGNFYSTCDFDPSTNVYNLSANSLTDAYIVKYNETTITNKQEINSQNIRIYPNPSSGVFLIENLNQNENMFIELYDINGMMVKKDYFIDYKSAIITISSPPGVYFIKFVDKDGSNSYYKIVKI